MRGLRRLTPQRSVAVEGTAVAALEAVVCLFRVSVVSHCNHVVVSRSGVVLCVHGRRVFHSLANLRHRIFSEIGFVFLIRKDLGYALGCLCIEQLRLLVLSLEKAFSCQGHKQLAICCCSKAT